MHWKTNPQGLSYAYRILGQIECMIHRSDTQRNVVAKTDSIDGKHRATNSQARSLKRRHPRILSEWMIRRGKTAFNIEVKRELSTECSNTQISMYQHLSFQKAPLNSFSAMQPRQCQSYAAEA